jgi:hypothetical protein
MMLLVWGPNLRPLTALSQTAFRASVLSPGCTLPQPGQLHNTDAWLSFPKDAGFNDLCYVMAPSSLKPPQVTPLWCQG